MATQSDHVTTPSLGVRGVSLARASADAADTAVSLRAEMADPAIDGRLEAHRLALCAAIDAGQHGPPYPDWLNGHLDAVTAKLKSAAAARCYDDLRPGLCIRYNRWVGPELWIVHATNEGGVYQFIEDGNGIPQRLSDIVPIGTDDNLDHKFLEDATVSSSEYVVVHDERPTHVAIVNGKVDALMHGGTPLGDFLAFSRVQFEQPALDCGGRVLTAGDEVYAPLPLKQDEWISARAVFVRYLPELRT